MVPARVKGRTMGVWTVVNRRVKAVLAPVFFLTVAAYFGWSATKGNHGLVASTERQAMLVQVQSDNAAARAERDGWARRVGGLRASNLDPDTLDERARAMLNLADPTDVVVQYPPKEKLF
jgi:cell division protein FtsB